MSSDSALRRSGRSIVMVARHRGARRALASQSYRHRDTYGRVALSKSLLGRAPRLRNNCHVGDLCGGKRMADTPATTLVFADRRRAGAYAVADQSGADVAMIRRGIGRERFVAEDPTGARLCAGSAGRWGTSNLWRATDSTGSPLLELSKDLWRARASLRLERGGELVVHGSVWRRDFEVRDSDLVVLSAVPRTSALSMRPYEYGVQQHSGRLTLAEVVAVVHIWRTLRKRDDASAAGAASTAVIASM